MPSDFIAPVEVLPSFTDVIANSGLNSNIPILIKTIIYGIKQLLVFMIKSWVTINYE